MNCIRPLIALVCGIVCASSVSAQIADTTRPKGPPAFGRLSPADLRVIQGMGRAVLFAHQTAIDDPVQVAVRNDMRELGAAVDQSLFTATPQIQIDAGKTLRPDANDIRDRRSGLRPDSDLPDRYVAVRSRLSMARQRTDRLRGGEAPSNAAESERAFALLTKAAALHDEIGAALDGPVADKGSRLAGLRERLRPRTLTEVLAEREAAGRVAGEAVAEPTPTITTIVRHR